MKPTCTARHAQKSLLTFALFLSASSLILSCASGEKDGLNRAAAPGDIPDEVSLRTDRSELDETRKNIPESVRKENDELATVLSMMSSGDEEPSRIRDRFNKALRTKRDKNDRLLRTRREDYMKKSRTEREDFLAKAKEERDDFTKGKNTAEQRKRFFEKQDGSRKAFFADANDKMKDFESKLTEDRKTFEDYARERQNQFNAQLRTYSENHLERKRALELKRRSEQKAQADQSGTSPAPAHRSADPLSEWRDIPKTPGTDLTPRNQ